MLVCSALFHINRKPLILNHFTLFILHKKERNYPAHLTSTNSALTLVFSFIISFFPPMMLAVVGFPGAAQPSSFGGGVSHPAS